MPPLLPDIGRRSAAVGDVAPATWNRHAATVRSFLAYAARHGLLPELRVALDRRREPADRTRALPSAALERLWSRRDIALRERRAQAERDRAEQERRDARDEQLLAEIPALTAEQRAAALEEIEQDLGVSPWSAAYRRFEQTVDAAAASEGEPSTSTATSTRPPSRGTAGPAAAGSHLTVRSGRPGPPTAGHINWKEPAVARHRSRPTSDAEREHRREASRRRLEKAARELLSSDGWARWARARAAFHRYSLHNTLLIAQQRPGATYVAGFRRWLELGRAVRKGEKGIRILGPVRRRVEDEDTGERVMRVVGYRDLAVFDVAQTDPLPHTDPAPLEAPGCAALTGDSHAHLLPRLEGLAGELGYSVSYEQLPDGVGGYCNSKQRQIVIDAAAAPNAQVRTAILWLAHALGVGYGQWAREEAEVIVESVIFCPGRRGLRTRAGRSLGDGCHRRRDGRCVASIVETCRRWAGATAAESRDSLRWRVQPPDVRTLHMRLGGAGSQGRA